MRKGGGIRIEELRKKADEFYPFRISVAVSSKINPVLVDTETKLDFMRLPMDNNYNIWYFRTSQDREIFIDKYLKGHEHANL